MMKDFKFQLIESYICPLCNSQNVELDVSGTGLKCMCCNYLGDDELFYDFEYIPDGREVCLNCGAKAKVKFYDISNATGGIVLKCICGKIDYIEKFIGEETIDDVVELEKKKMEANLKEIRAKKNKGRD